MTAPVVKPTAKDLLHHLSAELVSRNLLPLKTAFKYFGQPGMVFLGGGLPLSDSFPFEELSITLPAPPFANGVNAKPTGAGHPDTLQFTVAKRPGDVEHEKDVPLLRLLQYGYTEGQPELRAFVKEHTDRIHSPPYANWDVISSVGNTQLLDAVLRTFATRGDSILVEEFTFLSLLEAMQAQGISTVPVPLDEFGLIPEKLEAILDSWTSPNKPRLIYLIPTGQNPTGLLLLEDRRQKVYEIACKHDLIIIEDEPYYFLQMDAYTTDKAAREALAAKKMLQEEFVQLMVTSFIKLDTEGRVIRLDLFSKVLAPGARFGWIVGQEPLLERIVRLHEVTIQCPLGYTQLALNGVLQRWGQDGYIDWLVEMRKNYSHKRDVAIDAINAHFPKEVSLFVPPVAGMFFTVAFDATKHPKFATEFGLDPLKVENALYEAGLANNCLMIPGLWFRVHSKGEVQGTLIFFRGTYAAVPLDALALGLQHFGEAAAKEFGL